MDPRMVGLVSGLTGGVIGLLGGVIGTYFSIRNCQTKAEQRFMIRCAVAMWVLMITMLIAPTALAFFGVIPWFVVQILWPICTFVGLASIPRLNRRVAELRQVS